MKLWQLNTKTLQLRQIIKFTEEVNCIEFEAENYLKADKIVNAILNGIKPVRKTPPEIERVIEEICKN